MWRVVATSPGSHNVFFWFVSCLDTLMFPKNGVEAAVAACSVGFHALHAVAGSQQAQWFVSFLAFVFHLWSISGVVYSAALSASALG
jgi:hypothetical protein